MKLIWSGHVGHIMRLASKAMLPNLAPIVLAFGVHGLSDK